MAKAKNIKGNRGWKVMSDLEHVTVTMTRPAKSKDRTFDRVTISFTEEQVTELITALIEEKDQMRWARMAKGLDAGQSTFPKK